MGFQCCRRLETQLGCRSQQRLPSSLFCRAAVGLLSSGTRMVTLLLKHCKLPVCIQVARISTRTESLHTDAAARITDAATPVSRRVATLGRLKIGGQSMWKLDLHTYIQGSSLSLRCRATTSSISIPRHEALGCLCLLRQPCLMPAWCQGIGTGLEQGFAMAGMLGGHRARWHPRGNFARGNPLPCNPPSHPLGHPSTSLAVLTTLK